MSRKSDRRRKQRKAAAVAANPGTVVQFKPDAPPVTSAEVLGATDRVNESLSALRRDFAACSCPRAAASIETAADIVRADLRIAHAEGPESEALYVEAEEIEKGMLELFANRSLGAITIATRWVAINFARRALNNDACGNCGDTGSFLHNLTHVYVQPEEETPAGVLVN